MIDQWGDGWDRDHMIIEPPHSIETKRCDVLGMGDGPYWWRGAPQKKRKLGYRPQPALGYPRGSGRGGGSGHQ